MQASLNKRVEIITSVLDGRLHKRQAAQLLGKTIKTVENYQKRYELEGNDGLRDKRRSNYHRLTAQDKERILALKRFKNGLLCTIISLRVEILGIERAPLAILPHLTEWIKRCCAIRFLFMNRERLRASLPSHFTANIISFLGCILANEYG